MARYSTVAQRSKVLSRYEGTKKGMTELTLGFDAPPHELDVLDHPNSNFTVEEKLEGVIALMMTGSFQEASKYCRVKPEVLRHWKNKASWYPEAVKLARKMLGEVLESSLTAIIDKASDEIVDRLENGDEVLYKGKPIRRKLSARDLVTVMNMAFNQRQIIWNEPTTISEKKETTDSKLKEIEDRLSDLGKQLIEKKINTVVEDVKISTKEVSEGAVPKTSE